MGKGGVGAVFVDPVGRGGVAEYGSLSVGDVVGAQVTDVFWTWVGFYVACQEYEYENECE